MIHYQNGIQGFLNHGGWLNIDFVGSDGWISARNEHADFEMWSRHPQTGEPIRRQFPKPKRPKSSQQAARRGSEKPEGWEPTALPRRIRTGAAGNSDWTKRIASTRRRESRATAGRPNSGDRWTRLRIGSSTSLPISIEGLKLVSGTYRVRGNRTGISNLIWYPFLLSTSLFSYKFHIYLTPSFVLRF